MIWINYFGDLNFPPITESNLFKFQAQDSDLEYLFWRFDKHIALSEKELPLIWKGKMPCNFWTKFENFHHFF